MRLGDAVFAIGPNPRAPGMALPFRLAIARLVLVESAARKFLGNCTSRERSPGRGGLASGCRAWLDQDRWVDVVSCSPDDAFDSGSVSSARLKCIWREAACRRQADVRGQTLSRHERGRGRRSERRRRAPAKATIRMATYPEAMAMTSGSAWYCHQTALSASCCASHSPERPTRCMHPSTAPEPDG